MTGEEFSMAFELPALPYAKDALAPAMSAETLDFHHGKHHNTYVVNLNNLVKEKGLDGKSLDEIVKASYNTPGMEGVFNNAGQHWNHLLFWQMMKPPGGNQGGGGAMPGKLEAAIKDAFGGADQFKAAFKTAGTGQFGSGWAWLIQKPDGKLAVTKTANGVNPLATGEGTALLGCDVWEHSYYIDYRNDRGKYIDAFLNSLANWEFAASRMA
jgi:Fe-Mn family superoxide dismutase